MRDGRAALYRRVDWPASCLAGQEMELRLSWQREAQNLIQPPGRAANAALLRSHLRACRQTLPPARRFCFTILAESNAPGQFSNLNRLDDPQARHVDDRDVVRDAVGDQQIFLVRRKGAVPNSLTDQQIFQDGVSDAVDHRDPIGRPQIDEAEFAILGAIDNDGLDLLRSK